MPIKRFKRVPDSVRPHFGYWRDIGVVLCLKAVGLALLYFLFFAPSHQPVVDEQNVVGHLFTSAGPNSATR